MTRINTNVSSLNAQKSLRRSNVQLQEALTRLSTGLRINKGKDDPAGLIASETLRSDIVSVERAITNSERANQMIATADSALGEVSGLLNDIRGLITEAANEGALSAEQIAANQLQVDSSLEALNQIAQTTSFQGRRLLDGSLDFVTDAGSVSTIEDLQIDQANLGATGSIAVDVDVSAAATQAVLRSASGTANASTTLYFSASAEFAAGDFNGSAAAFDVKAAALGNTEGGVTITFANDAPGVGLEYAVYDADNKTLVVHIPNAATNVANVVNAIDNLDEWTAIDLTVGGGNIDGNNAAHTGVSKTTGVDSLAITAATAGPDLNDVSVSVTTQNGLGATTPTATYYSDTRSLVITIDDTTATTLAKIDNAINNNVAEFNSAPTSANNATGRIEGAGGIDTLAIANTGISGYLDSGFSAATNATATLSFAAGTEFDATTFNGSAAAFDVNAAALGTSESGVTISFTNDATAAGSETAEYDADAKTLLVHIPNGATNVSNVVNAINNLDEWSATLVSAATENIDGSNANHLAVTKVTGVDSLDITATVPGADYNNLAISVATKAAGTAPTAVYDATANTLVITMSSTATSDLTAIDAVIDAMPQFQSAHHARGSTRVIGSGADANATANTGTTGGNTLLDDLVVRLGGSSGVEAFTFESGASVNQMVSAVNLVSDATGVSASQSHGLLTLTSVKYGSSGLAYADVISEGSNGTFEDALSASRATGTDITATVNGISADGDGNTLSINTATLDLSITVTAGSSQDFDFNITGGGALFQIGPEVVSNQQARLGIQSVNTATLGGQSGKLYQLASGGTASLTTDTTTAANIVDEVITKVTSLRGRLGAFQRTTLQTNINSLEDTLENLTEAESAIRDADFAAESAALTRAQILVQSGVSVLAIANTNPQNVLALLR